jgi:hypothetical protein
MSEYPIHNTELHTAITAAILSIEVPPSIALTAECHVMDPTLTLVKKIVFVRILTYTAHLCRFQAHTTPIPAFVKASAVLFTASCLSR